MEKAEQKVLNYLIRGWTSQMIASRLRVSKRIIEYRREKIMKHYEARSPFHLGFLVGREEGIDIACR